jgi:DNA processing protein
VDDLFGFMDHELPSKSQLTIGELGGSEWLLAMMQIPGIGSGTAIKLAQEFSSVKDLLSATEVDLGRVGNFDLDEIMRLRPTAIQQGDDLRALSFFESDYPQELKELKNPPAVLWVKGTLKPVKNVAIVGTRQPSQEGYLSAESCGSEAANLGIGVVSGLALGVDSAAHRGVLREEGYTVAVLASDVLNPTPDSNVPLAHAILDAGGCLVSESPPNTSPTRHGLVQRNRIQAALSKSIVIPECGYPSGTFSTIAFGFELERLIVVFKPESNSQSSKGNELLVALSGINPDYLDLSKKLKEKAGKRKPFADVVLENLSDFKEHLRSI